MFGDPVSIISVPSPKFRLRFDERDIYIHIPNRYIEYRQSTLHSYTEVRGIYTSVQTGGLSRVGIYVQAHREMDRRHTDAHA